MGAVSTNLPLSCPLNLARSSSLVMSAKTASAVTGPLVPGVQALAYAIRGNGCGAVTCTEVRSLDQPRPKGPQRSRWTFESFHSLILSVVHLAASLMLGELVRRGP